MSSDHPDPAFPRLHGRPAKGWLNDPNGCSYVDGRYHVFFQYNPDAPVHHAIKWGHVSSTDLLRWQEEPIALVNRDAELDSFGCWSGCVIDDHGVPTAVYSAVADNSGRAEVVLARSDRRMQTWTSDRNSVIGMPADPDITEVRDPYVFELDGRRYAIQGAGNTRGGPARVLVYGCDDLTSWTELGTLVSADDPVADDVAAATVWECPNLVRMGEHWLLIVSLWHWIDGAHSLGGARYLLGDVVVGPQGPRFTARSGGKLDRGPCFYAPQALALDHRTLLWAWSWEHGRPEDDVARSGWAGSLTFCRELSLHGDTLVARPAHELNGLRRDRLDVLAGRRFTASSFEIEMGAATAARASLWLVDGGEEQQVAAWDVSSTFMAPRLLVDGSMVEIFDGGPAGFTTRAYPTETSAWLLRLEEPAPLQAWQLGLP